MTFGRITVLLGVIFAAVFAWLWVYPEMYWILPVAASEQAAGIDFLFWFMMVSSAGVFIFVQGFLLYFVWIFRRQPDEPEDAIGRNIHGDNRLEIAWTAIPALFLVVLTILSFQELENLKLDEDVPGSHIVEVEGFQFAWSFTHPETGIVESNQLTLLKDEPVTFNITSRDVTHAFWVPEFRIKQDATAGAQRKINITPNMTHKEAGYDEGFPLRCAELCGAGHSDMIAKVRVVEQAEYLAWQQEALNPSTPVGVQLYQANGCIGCHQLDIADAVGAVGPTHNDMATIVESRLNDPSYTGSASTAEEYLIESVRDPNAYVVPEYAPGLMPALSAEQLSDEDLNELIKMLLEQ